jgi:hypothetical protein
MLSIVYPGLMFSGEFLFTGSATIGPVVLLKAVEPFRRLLLFVAWSCALGLSHQPRESSHKALGTLSVVGAFTLTLFLLGGNSDASTLKSLFAEAPGLSVAIVLIFTAINAHGAISGHPQGKKHVAPIVVLSTGWLVLLFLPTPTGLLWILIRVAFLFPVILTSLRGIHALDNPNRATKPVAQTFVAIATILIPSLIAAFAPLLLAFQKITWAASSPAFLLLVFLCILPTLNAFADTVSVAVTQSLLRRYRDVPRQQYLLWSGELLASTAAVILVYFGTLGALLSLQLIGWDIDARSLIQQFVKDPWDSQVLWITSLALTNIAPALLHLGFLLWGIMSWSLVPEPAGLRQRLDQLAEGRPLHKVDARALVSYLVIDRWLSAAFAICLLLVVALYLVPWMFVSVLGLVT